MPLKKEIARKGNVAADAAKQIGRYIVADPKICHGQPTFRGTRIFVSDVLDQVASGTPWNRIVDQWRGSIPPETIAEAIRLAKEMFVRHADEYVPPAYRQKKAS